MKSAAFFMCLALCTPSSVASASASASAQPARASLTQPHNTQRHDLEGATQDSLEEFWHRALTEPVAAFTGILALFTIALVDVSGVQIAFLSRADSLANRSLTTSQRAFVYLEGFDIDVRTNPNLAALWVTYCAVTPRWRNSGNTPTRFMRIRTAFVHGIVGPPKADFAFSDFIVGGSPFFLGPGTTQKSDMMEIPAGIISQFIDGGLGRGPCVYLIGRAEYLDVFSNTIHHTNWCYLLRFFSKDATLVEADYIQTGEFNGTDDYVPLERYPFWAVWPSRAFNWIRYRRWK